MNEFDEECLNVFLENQSQLFEEAVAETLEDAEAFLAIRLPASSTWHVMPRRFAQDAKSSLPFTSSSENAILVYVPSSFLPH